MDSMTIRQYDPGDEKEIIDLWKECNLIVPWNDPAKDIQRKCYENPTLFFVGSINGKIAGSCMAGYDGHRGWLYYLAVKPEYQKLGNAKKLIVHAEKALINVGCPKINLMVRKTNERVIGFYKTMGYADDSVIVLSKRLKTDQVEEKNI